MSTTAKLSEEVRRLSALAAYLRQELEQQKRALSEERSKLRDLGEAVADLLWRGEQGDGELDVPTMVKRLAIFPTANDPYAGLQKQTIEALVREVRDLIGLFDPYGRGRVNESEDECADRIARAKELADGAEKTILEIGQSEPQCNPTLTECPRCKNDILKCDGTFAGRKGSPAVGNAVLSPLIEDAALGFLDGRVGEYWHDFRWAAAKREQTAFVEGAQLAQRTTSITGDGWMKEEAKRRYPLPLSVRPFVPQTIPSQVRVSTPTNDAGANAAFRLWLADPRSPYIIRDPVRDAHERGAFHDVALAAFCAGRDSLTDAEVRALSKDRLPTCQKCARTWPASRRTAQGPVEEPKT